MAKQTRGGTMSLSKKQLINVSEQHKEWIARVVTSANEAGHPTNQTDIIRALLDQAMGQEPENFVTHLQKIKLRARLDDLARREKELMEEKEKLAQELDSKQLVKSSN